MSFELELKEKPRRAERQVRQRVRTHESDVRDDRAAFGKANFEDKMKKPALVTKGQTRVFFRWIF